MRLSEVRFYTFDLAGTPCKVSAAIWESLEGPAPADGWSCDGCSNSPDRYLTWTWKMYKLWPACVIHDWHYHTGVLGGNWHARREADRIFRQNMVRQLAMQGAGRVRQQSMAWMYWGRVRLWGASSYALWDDGEAPLSKWERFREVYGLFKDNT